MHADAGKMRAVWQVATRLRDHLERPIQIHDLAWEAGLSERQFHRLFHSVLGESPAAHVRRLRLERTAAWLAYTDFPVIGAALAGGYDSREGFTREFHEHFGCAPGAFRQRVRADLRRVPDQCPATLGKPYALALPPMRVAAWPHLGAGLGAPSVWVNVGRWGCENGLLTPHTLPVSVLHDDEGIAPSAHARLDAALVIAPDWTPADAETLPLLYDLPGGRHAIAPFEGSLYQLEAAWNHFALRWFPASGHALRDPRLLMLHDADDVPTRACEFFPLVGGRVMRCRLCIPVDHVPAPGLPRIQAACVR